MMPEQYYNPLSDLGKIKESLIALFYNMEDLTRLVPHCFDTPYIEGMTDRKSTRLNSSHMA